MRPPWKMPDWMRPFVPYIGDTGGNDIEDLVNDQDTNVVTNAPRALICVAVKCQVFLLQQLHRRGWLKKPSKYKPKDMDKEYMQLAGEAVHAKLPDNYGFVIFAFPFNEEGRCRYASNAKREDVIKLLKSWLIQASGEEEWMNHIK